MLWVHSPCPPPFLLPISSLVVGAKQLQVDRPEESKPTGSSDIGISPGTGMGPDSSQEALRRHLVLLQGKRFQLFWESRRKLSLSCSQCPRKHVASAAAGCYPTDIRGWPLGWNWHLEGEQKCKDPRSSMKQLSHCTNLPWSLPSFGLPKQKLH